MTMFAPSDISEINVSTAHGGCGQRHARGTDETGQPVQPWGITCPSCETFLASEGRFSKTVDGIKETFDETLAREAWETKGIKDRDALLAVAMARMAGVSQSQIPPTVQRMISGLQPHIPVAGEMICPKGHTNVPGGRYCSACGAQMSAPAPSVALTAGQAG
jgi:hypothetical protein